MTPENYRDALTQKLVVQRTTMLDDERYLEGTQPMAFVDPEIVRATEGRVRPLNINLARLVVEVLGQRLTVTGFRSSPGQVMDDALMRLWQSQGMDEQAKLAQTDALTYGRAYFIAWADSLGNPVITAESPLQMAVARDPMTRRVIAALKRWMDDDGHLHALILTSDEVTEWMSRTRQPDDVIVGTIDLPFITDQLVEVRREPNPLGLVPVVPLVNRPRLDNLDGTSELADIKQPLSALGKVMSDFVLASEYAAAPRRWATGLLPAGAHLEQMADIKTRVKEEWERAHASKFILASGAEARFGAFPTADLENYRVGVDILMGEIASMSGLPAHYLIHSAANPTSADAIRTSEARLTARAKDRQDWWSGPYEDLMRLAVMIRDGQADPSLDDLETLWADPEPSTIAQTADAQAKLFGAGIVDRRSALEALGFTPLEIERILTEAVPV